MSLPHPKHTHYEIQQHENWTVISIKDAAHTEMNANWICTLVDEAILAGKYHVAFCFEKETYLYSKLIAIMVSCAKKLKSQQGSFAIINPALHVRETLEALKLLNTVITAVPTVNDLN